MKTCPQCHMRYPQDATRCFVDGADLVASRDPRIGQTIAGRYVIEEVIGEGGMAVVYRAHHKLVDRPCAIKIMNPALARDKVVLERFRREAKSAQALAHPNIIEIFDQGDTEDGTAYIVMELLEGSALVDVIGATGLPLERAIPIMIQMSRGIARAHDLGIIHRDLKPENTFICRRDDGTDLVKLLDFGIARSRTDSRLTNAGELFGTPQYMAPERVQTGDAGPNVDLYALGVIFFEIVTGALPIEADDPTSFLIKHIKEPPRRPRSINPNVPPELEALILALLAKDPKARPVDAHRVENDLGLIARAHRIEIPIEPEADPASQREIARTLPAVAVHQWARRTYVFEQMLARAFGGAPPAELKKMHADLVDLVRRVTDLRASAVGEQRKLEEIDKRGRDGRQRFGFAVDALGLDASKAKDDVRGSALALAAEREKVAAAGARFATLQREIMIWEGRAGFHEPYAELSAAYRVAADAVDVWLATRIEEQKARKIAETHERGATDLEYQIRELRAALEAHERNIEAEHKSLEKTIIEMNQQAEQMERMLVQLASRFCEPLRTRPKLAPYFQQLEEGAAA